jgi:hypothetical protein
MSESENTAGELNAEIARKLQAKSIVGNVKKFVPKLGDDDKPTKAVAPLFQIWGHAHSVKRGESDYGPYVGLLGRFEAINITTDKDGKVDGTVFAGPQCFLPEPMASMLAEQLEAMTEEKDADGKVVLVDGKPKMRRLVDSLEFAFEIGVKATETVVGYEYTTRPIIKPGGADPLAELRKRIPGLPGNAPALAPPAAEAQAEAAKGGGKKK